MAFTQNKIHSATDDFNKIYEAAKKGKSDEVSQLMHQGICIDVYSFGPKGIETPAGRLAREGRVTAVEILADLGANTDRIIPGFILGGHEKQAQSFQKKFGSDIDLVAYAAAAAGNHKLVQTCINNGARLGMIAGGYALKKDYKKIDLFLENEKKDDSITTEIAKGSIIAKDDKRVEELVKLHNADADVVARTYAMAGDLKKAESYVEKYNASANQIAQGLVMGGYFKEAREYYGKHPETMNGILAGLAAAGHIKEIDYYRSFPDFNNNYLTKVLAYHNHHDAVKKSSADPKYIAEGYALGGNIRKLAEVLAENNMDATKDHVDKIYTSGRYKNNNAIYTDLTAIQDDGVLGQLCQYFSEKLDVNDMSKYMTEVRDLRSLHDLNYRQAVAYLDPDFKKILTESMPLVNKGKMSFDILVTNLNAFGSLTPNEVKDLYNKTSAKKAMSPNSLEASDSGEEYDERDKFLKSSKQKPGLFNKGYGKLENDDSELILEKRPEGKRK